MSPRGVASKIYGRLNHEMELARHLDAAAPSSRANGMPIRTNACGGRPPKIGQIWKWDAQQLHGELKENMSMVAEDVAGANE